ncbi:hypothetical protein BH23GEM2_BH23GEM2_19920 [soil metagenome]
MRATYGAAIAAVVILAGCNDRKATIVEPSAAELHDHPGMGSAVTGEISTPGGVSVEPLGRSSFPDDINVMFRIKQGRATNVVQVDGPSDVLLAKITVQPGGSFGWHTHHGPVIVTVVSGTLSVINASDCVDRTYPAGTAFVDPGQGNVHVGFNQGEVPVVVYGTFLDVPPGQPATIPADPRCAS